MHRVRPPGDGSPPRWRGHPIAAFAVRALVVLVPAIAGAAAGVVVTRATLRAFGVVLGLGAALGVSAGVAIAVEAAARRLLPLATLLKLSLAFPDRVPSRFKVARSAGNVRVLRERVLAARRDGVDDDPARAAEQILTLVAGLAAHDRKTRGHSERVRAFTDVLAEHMGVSGEDRDKLRWSSLLHDIGKLEVPSATLNKAGKPDDQEWEQLKRHPLEGARIAAPLLPWLGEWGLVIAEHHERYDGTGYPMRLGGDKICLGARIVAVADSFEVMTASRSYKRPMTPSAARVELARCAGTQFDPGVVRALFAISLGRLWWMVGPAAWVAQIPFMLGIGRAGSETVVAVRAAGEIATRAVAAFLAVALSGAAATPALADGTRGREAGASTGVTTLAADATSASGSTSSAAAVSSEGSASGAAGSKGPGGGAPGSASSSGVGSTTERGAGSVSGTANAVDQAVDAASGAVDQTVGAATDAVDQTVDTATGAVDQTVDTATGAASDAASALGLGDASPSP